MLNHAPETDSFAFWVHDFSLNFLMDISLIINDLPVHRLVAVIPRVVKILTI